MYRVALYYIDFIQYLTTDNDDNYIVFYVL